MQKKEDDLHDRLEDLKEEEVCEFQPALFKVLFFL